MGKPYKITVGVKYDKRWHDYDIFKLSSPDKCCRLCKSVYEEVIGKEVVGKVTFILRKIDGKAKDYIHPFRIRNSSLEIHQGYWYYGQCLSYLKDAFDSQKLKKWAGTSKFSIEMEW